MKGEPRSIVIMDNASTHMDGCVEQMIRAKGAILIYAAPFSPDLNPIELAFNIYKAHLKRNMDQYENNWYQIHLDALAAVNRDICVKEFQRCSMLMSQDLMLSLGEAEVVAAITTMMFLEEYAP